MVKTDLLDNKSKSFANGIKSLILMLFLMDGHARGQDINTTVARVA